MDMYPASKGGSRGHFLNHKFVYDRLQFVKMMNDTIDKVRRKDYQTNKNFGKNQKSGCGMDLIHASKITVTYL